MFPVKRMSNNYLERLDASADRFPDKPAYISEQFCLTYRQLREKSMRVGTCLARSIHPRQTVAVLMQREVWAVAAVMGVIQAGGICSALDPTMPAERMLKIFENLQPGAIVIDESARALAEELRGRVSCPVIDYFEAEQTAADPELLQNLRDHSSRLDPIHIYYTSGSTGQPKGVVHTHNSILNYADRASDHTDVITDSEVYGNQAPFFYANSINDIYLAIDNGCTVYIIPDHYFKFPETLVRCLNEKQITTLLMTPLNYIYVADAGVLTPGCLPHMRSVYMCGEVVPYEKMKIWAQAASNAICFNFYGATEFPYSTEYVLGSREFAQGEPVPAGQCLRGARIFILDENGDEVPQGESGEIYIHSPWLSSGYFRDPERTASAYLNDPLGYGWNCTMFRSGDIGRIDEEGQLLVLGRKDTQIKHRGFRMDIGEVDAALRGVEHWQNGCCLFDAQADLLYCFWTGPLTEAELKDALSTKIEKYMLPNVWIHLSELPRTSSGKLDRVGLKGQYFK